MRNVNISIIFKKKIIIKLHKAGYSKMYGSSMLLLHDLDGANKVFAINTFFIIDNQIPQFLLH